MCPYTLWVKCSPMAWDTGVQSQVESYQRLKKWYLMLTGLILAIIRYESRINRKDQEKGVAPFPTLWCSRYIKEAIGSPATIFGQLI